MSNRFADHTQNFPRVAWSTLFGRKSRHPQGDPRRQSQTPKGWRTTDDRSSAVVMFQTKQHAHSANERNLPTHSTCGHPPGRSTAGCACCSLPGRKSLASEIARRRQPTVDQNSLAHMRATTFPSIQNHANECIFDPNEYLMLHLCNSLSLRVTPVRCIHRGGRESPQSSPILPSWPTSFVI